MADRQDDRSVAQAKLTGILKSEISIPILERTPKYVRLICLCSSALLFFTGLLITLKQDVGNPAATLGWIFLWLLFAVGLALFFFFLYHFLDRLTSRHAMQLLDSSYAEEGWNPKLAQYAMSMHPVALTDDRLFAMFLSVMAEDYDAQSLYMLGLEGRTLTPRQNAVKELCRLRKYTMLGDRKHAEKLFAEMRLETDAAYEEQPDLIRLRNRRSYTDDALVWYETALGFAVRAGNDAEAEHYRKLVLFRISLRDEDEQDILREILALEECYAAGRLDGLHERQLAVYRTVRERFALTQRGKHSNLQRKLEQAPIYGIFLAETQGADGEAFAQSRYERRLPGADYLSGN